MLKTSKDAKRRRRQKYVEPPCDAEAVVLIAGDEGVGTSALLQRFITDTFTPDATPEEQITLGLDYAARGIDVAGPPKGRLKLRCFVHKRVMHEVHERPE